MFLVYSGNIWKQDILYCWGNASNKEENRRDAAIKQKTEGIPYRTIARNLDKRMDKRVDGIRSKRNNAGEYQRYLLIRTRRGLKKLYQSLLEPLIPSMMDMRTHMPAKNK